MKTAVVTSIFGGIDKLNEIPPQTVKFDYHVFSDKDTLHFLEKNDRLQAKYYKICTHKVLPSYDIIIWIDGCLEILSNQTVEYLVDQLGDDDILLQKHFYADDIYQEEQIMISAMSDPESPGYNYLTTRFSKEEITKQVDAYRDEIKPLGGYWLGGLFARKINEKTNHFFDGWWDKILKYGCRDQFSLAYMVQTFKDIKIKEIKSIMNTEYIKWHSHLKIK